MNLRQQTIATYDESAQELAEYFRGIGPRVKYIDIGLEYAGSPKNARVVEIGCGDGRDAKEIVKKSAWFLGFDISKELIKLARAHVPEGRFEIADAVSFDYPRNLDAVFAFASLLHLDKEEVGVVLKKVHAALKQGGVFYISLKYRPEYTNEVKEDRFGRRLFYFYNADLIAELAGAGYEVADTWREVIGRTDWFEIVLRKK